MFKAILFFAIHLMVIFLLFFTTKFSLFSKQNEFHFSKAQRVNHAPKVKIVSPKNNSEYAANSVIRYQIRVSDQEDGDSKFGEINSKEVFLEIRYVNDTSKALANMKEGENNNGGLSIIRTSNCMNCHAFKSKLIGPSFEQMTTRYKYSAAEEDSLSNHILQGSSGRWGTPKMPSNTDLNKEQAKKIVSWLFRNANNSAVNYLAGTEGSFKLNSPADSLKNVVLIASYTDHGVKGQTGQKLQGKDIILLHEK